MKYCQKCSLTVVTNDHFCPLCSASLTGDDKAAASVVLYPKIEDKSKYNLTVRLLLFLSIVAASACLLINILAYQGILWSLLVVGGIAFFWAAFVYPFLSKKNIGHYITIDAVCACLFFIVAQFVTKTNGWSLDYVIPFLFIAATTIISFVILIRRMKWREYALYQFITIILGLLPVISAATGLVIITWPSIASAFYSFVTLLGMLIFADKKYKNELIKRFHF
jgi:RNA polymerase subunit RPABC4/transcription elongation factor Spt4